MTDSDIEIPKTRGRPFEKGHSGNPAGKPRGRRNASTLIAEALLEGESEALIAKLLELAHDGNMAALRMAVERLVPPRRERPLRFELPPLESPADAPAAMSCIVAGLAEGVLTGSEVKALVGLVEAYLKVQSQIENDLRLSALEAMVPEIMSRIEEMKSMFVPIKL